MKLKTNGLVVITITDKNVLHKDSNKETNTTSLWKQKLETFLKPTNEWYTKTEDGSLGIRIIKYNQRIKRLKDNRHFAENQKSLCRRLKEKRPPDVKTVGKLLIGKAYWTQSEKK